MAFVYVFIGGGLGSMLRYAIGLAMEKLDLHNALATFTSNAIACLIFGMMAGYILKDGLADNYKLLLLTGFCGGFSTFSTFTYDTSKFIGEGQLLYALGNIMISVVICLVFFMLGYKWSGQ